MACANARIDQAIQKVSFATIYLIAPFLLTCKE